MVVVLAYNLGNFMRRLTLAESVKHWSLRSVQTKLIKMGGRLVRHARRFPQVASLLDEAGCFSLLRWQCPGRYSGKCWSVSPGSIQHQSSDYP